MTEGVSPALRPAAVELPLGPSLKANTTVGLKPDALSNTTHTLA